MKYALVTLLVLCTASLALAQTKAPEAEVIVTTKAPTGTVFRLITQQGDSTKDHGLWIRIELYNDLRSQFLAVYQMLVKHTNEAFSALNPQLAKVLNDSSYVIVKKADLQKTAPPNKKKK